MARLTTTSRAVLGLLSVRPWSAYELAQQIERSLGWFWPRTPRKIYDEAKRLVDAGFAASEATSTGQRRRTVYSITERGRRELRRWLAEPSEPLKLESEGLVRLFFADAGDLSHLRSTLEGMRAGADDRISTLRSMIDAIDDGSDEFARRRSINALGLRFQLDHHRMVRTWSDWALDATATWQSPTEAAGWDWRSALS